MSKTRQDLIVNVLGLLNVVGVGDTPSAEDVETVGGIVEPKVAELARREIVYIPDVEQIDDEIFDALTQIVAEAVGPRFGLPRSAPARLEAEGILIEMNAAGGRETVKAEYF